MEAGDLIEGPRGVLVRVGLARPEARAFVAAVAVGITAYAFRLPPSAFTEEDQLRPFKLTSKSPHATYAHFLAVPLTAGALTYVFT